MANILWQYWEKAPGVSKTPPHVVLGGWSVEVANPSIDFRRIGPSDLPGLLPDLDPRVQAIRLNPRGRIEKYLYQGRLKRKAIPVKVDIIRALLLEKYGGVWTDADALFFQDISPVFEDIDRHGFICTRRASFGKNHVPVNFYGTVPGGIIIQKYCDALRSRLSGSSYYDYNEAGATTLTKIIDTNSNQAKLYPERFSMPFPFETADDVLFGPAEPEKVKETLDGSAFTLIFGDRVNEETIESLYHGETLIGALYRAAIPRHIFDEKIKAYKASPY